MLVFSALRTRGPVALSPLGPGRFGTRRATLMCPGPQCQGDGEARLDSPSLPMPERRLSPGVRGGDRSASGLLRDGVGVAGQWPFGRCWLPRAATHGGHQWGPSHSELTLPHPEARGRPGAPGCTRGRRPSSLCPLPSPDTVTELRPHPRAEWLMSRSLSDRISTDPISKRLGGTRVPGPRQPLRGRH